MQTKPAPLTARRNGPLAGRARVPGDKSISIRALILGALAVGETRVSGLARRRRCAQHREGPAGAGRRSRADRRAAMVDPWRRRRRLCRTRRRPRFRQFRNRLPARARRGRRLSDHRDIRRRCLAAQPADAARARSAGTDRRTHACIGGRPLAADARGRARSYADRVRAAGSVGAIEIGDAARRPFRAGRNRRDRSASRRATIPRRCSLHFGADVRVEPGNGNTAAASRLPASRN